MRIQVHGYPTKISPTETRYAIRYFLTLILPKKYYKDFKIRVEYLNLHESYGCCDIEEYDDSDDFLPRHFYININNRKGYASQLKTLAHELIHIKQFATGELRHLTPDVIIWRKKKINIDEVEYWDLPQEIEAYGRESGMYYRYKAHLKQEGVEFGC